MTAAEKWACFSLRVSNPSCPFQERCGTGTARGLLLPPPPENGKAAAALHIVYQCPVKSNADQLAVTRNHTLGLVCLSRARAMEGRWVSASALRSCSRVQCPGSTCHASIPRQIKEQRQIFLDYSHEPKKQDLAWIQQSVSYPPRQCRE